ncbi:MAG TPA: BrnT family toxin [Candidatus Saccharimonadales bacterium]|nr:BrnT family toxin [Candidatus Saccharimonadales bacterium]
MRLLTLPLFFDWDEGNLSKNRKKHSVGMQEAEQIFFNKPLLLSDTNLHSTSEKRYKALGKTNDNRELLAIFTLRNNKLRIISIRDMSRRERKEYENTKENPNV